MGDGVGTYQDRRTYKGLGCCQGKSTVFSETYKLQASRVGPFPQTIPLQRTLKR